MTLVESELDYGALPEIDDNVAEEFYNQVFMTYLGGDKYCWTQTAVDFACLATGNLNDKIVEQAVKIEALEGYLEKTADLLLECGEMLAKYKKAGAEAESLCERQGKRIEDLKMALLLIVYANPLWSVPLSTEEEIKVDRIIADAESN